MAVGWFLVPYKRRVDAKPIRYCSMDDFSTIIFGDSGNWSEVEVLGNHAIVKVRASTVTISNLNRAPDFTNFSLLNLDDTYVDVKQIIRDDIREKIIALGYSAKDFDSTFPPPEGILNSLLEEVLNFTAQTRLEPRYDVGLDEIILDGPPQPTKPIRVIDQEVTR